MVRSPSSLVSPVELDMWDTEPGDIPCHRIVFAGGRLAEGFAFGGPEVQRALLEDEGVAFLANGHVDLQASRWPAGLV